MHLLPPQGTARLQMYYPPGNTERIADRRCNPPGPSIAASIVVDSTPSRRDNPHIDRNLP